MESSQFTSTPWSTPLNGCFCVEFCRFTFTENLSLDIYVQCRRTLEEWETYEFNFADVYSYSCLRNLLFFSKRPMLKDFAEPMRLNKWTSILSGSDWENSIDKETLATSNIVQYKLETDTHLFEIMCAEKPAIKRLTELEIEMGGIKRQKKMDVYHSPEEKEKISRFHENLKKDPKSNQN